MTMRKLCNEQKIKKKDYYLSDELTKAILEWRSYVATRFDKNLDHVLREDRIPKLYAYLKDNDHRDWGSLAAMLKELEVDDDHEKSARLLSYHLEDEATKRQKIDNKPCRRCNEFGHLVSCRDNYNFSLTA